MSLISEKRLAANPQCPAAARVISATATHKSGTSVTENTGAAARAQASMVVLRAAFTLHPRPSSADEIQPPAIPPKPAPKKMTIRGRLLPCRSSPKCRLRNFGPQKM